MKRILGSVLAVVLVVCGCAAVLKKAGQEAGKNHVTILYSHFMSGYLEPCG